MIFRNTVILLLIFITGCASTPDPIPTLNLKNQKSIVYLYRPYVWDYGGASCAKFYIDTEEAKTLSNGGGVSFEVAAGQHQLKAKKAWCFVYPYQLNFKTEANKITYVRYGYSNFPKPGFIQGGMRGDPWSGLEVVSEEFALKELKKD